MHVFDCPTSSIQHTFPDRDEMSFWKSLSSPSSPAPSVTLMAGSGLIWTEPVTREENRPALLTARPDTYTSVPVEGDIARNDLSMTTHESF